MHLLYPLDEFYAGTGHQPPFATHMEGDAMPEPYRSLLVHERDMTPTLEAAHGGRLRLQVLTMRVENGVCARHVLLVLESDGTPVELGAIRIYLDRFPPAARQRIVHARTPLGTILREENIPHQSRPAEYFSVIADGLTASALRLESERQLFGRRNVLRDPQGETLAEVLEIVPPVSDQAG